MASLVPFVPSARVDVCDFQESLLRSSHGVFDKYLVTEESTQLSAQKNVARFCGLD